MFRYAMVVALLATGTASATEGDVAKPIPFSGRSGATKVRIIFACGVPDPEAKAEGGIANGLAARIKDAGKSQGLTTPG